MTFTQQALWMLHFLPFNFRLHRKARQCGANCKKNNLLESADELSYVDKKTNLYLSQGWKAILSGFARLVWANWWSQLQHLKQSISMFACLCAATRPVTYSVLTSLIKTPTKLICCGNAADKIEINKHRILKPPSKDTEGKNRRHPRKPMEICTISLLDFFVLFYLFNRNYGAQASFSTSLILSPGVPAEASSPQAASLRYLQTGPQRRIA